MSKSFICGSSVQSFNPIYLWYDYAQEHYEVLVRVQGVSQPFVDDKEPAFASQSSAPYEQNSVHGDFCPIISQPISGSVDSDLNRVSSLSGDGEALGQTGCRLKSKVQSTLQCPSHEIQSKLHPGIPQPKCTLTIKKTTQNLQSNLYPCISQSISEVGPENCSHTLAKRKKAEKNCVLGETPVKKTVLTFQIVNNMVGIVITQVHISWPPLKQMIKTG